MRTFWIVLIVVGGLFSPPGLSGQGTLRFVNTASSRVFTNLSISGGTTGPAQGVRVGLLYSADTNNFSPANWLTNASALTRTGALAGLFDGGVCVVPGVAAGQYIRAKVRAWPAPYPTWEAALAACPSTYIGESLPFLVGPLGDNFSVIPNLSAMGPFDMIMPAGPAACVPIVTIVPEGSPFQLRIDPNGSVLSCIRIEVSSTLASNSWQVVTNIASPGGGQPFVWTAPVPIDARPQFYRVSNRIPSGPCN